MRSRIYAQGTHIYIFRISGIVVAFRSAADDMLDDNTVMLALPASCGSIQSRTVQNEPSSVRYMVAAVYPAGTHVEKEQSFRRRPLKAQHLHVAAMTTAPSVGSCGEGPVNSLLTAGDTCVQASSPSCKVWPVR